MKVLLFFSAAAFCACAGPRPVLYPNDHFKTAGDQQVEADTADCRAQAKKYVKEHKKELVARRTGWGAAGGAAMGAIVGAFTGDYARAASQGAAVGAAAGLGHGVAEASSPDAVHRRFVDLCLSEKGYQPIGWK
ncbi:MAG: cell envelope biogenesis protein OmpA [Elusimicrobiota bacterium]